MEGELQAKLDESKKQVVEYYMPLAKKNMPDELVGCLLKVTENDIRFWIEEQLDSVFPDAEELVDKMTLTDLYKDVTYETLNHPDFLDSVKAAFPKIDWDKAYNEFKAAGEQERAD